MLRTRQNVPMSIGTGRPDRRWTFAARTHVGLVREGNEDSYAAEPGIWVVADGLGGHNGGEVASATAVQAVTRSLAAAGSADDLSTMLPQVFDEAANAVRDYGRGNPGLSGMGTTLVVAVADPAGTVHVGSIGDSRAYLLRDGTLVQLVRDDNFAEELLAAGQITAEEARVHQGQFWLTRAIIADQSDPGPPHVALASGPGRLLLCSDGLNSELTDDDIASLLDDSDVDTAAEALVAAAIDAGGRDNITVVVVDLPASD